MDAYLEQQTRGAFASHNGNYDDPGATKLWFWRAHIGKRLDQLEEYQRRWLLRKRLEGPLPWMIQDFEDFKLIHDRFLEKLEEQNRPRTSILEGRPKEMEETVDMDESYIAIRARNTRSALNIFHPMGEYLGMHDSSPPDPNETYKGHVINDKKQSDVGGNRRARSGGIEHGADNPDGGQTSTSESELPTLTTHGYLQHATSMLRDTSCMTQIITANCHASRSYARTKSRPEDPEASKRKCSKRSKHPTFASQESGDLDSTSQPNHGHELSSSFEDPKDPRASSNKRKCDAMLNLANSSSQYARSQPMVLPGSKGRKQRRKSFNPRRRSLPSTTSRQPLASLNIKNSTISSRTKQEKSLTSSYLETGSPGTIVVRTPTSNESPAPRPKRRKGGTRASEGLEAYFWR